MVKFSDFYNFHLCYFLKDLFRYENSGSTKGVYPPKLPHPQTKSEGFCNHFLTRCLGETQTLYMGPRTLGIT